MLNQQPSPGSPDDQVPAADPTRALWLVRCPWRLARDSVVRWHYTRRLPCVTSDNYSVFEFGRFVGVVVFGPGSAWAAKHLGLERPQVCELARVSLGRHKTPISRVVAIALRLLRGDRPVMRAVVSYADTAQGHHGGIYQAGGWMYLGSVVTHRYRVNGEMIHGRTLGARYGPGGQSVPWLRANLDPQAARVLEPPKHKYVFPFDDEVRAALRGRVRPYPKRSHAQLA